MFRRIINRFYRHRENITLDEMFEILKTNDNVTLVDVRSMQEYNEGHLLGSINIPVYDMEAKAKQMLPYKEDIVIVYCSAGVRSKKALQILKRLGYKNIYHIEGGVQNL